MVLELNATLQGRLERWAQQGYPQECCGLLFGHVADGLVRVEEAMQAHNANTERALEDRKSTRLNSSHIQKSRMPSSA